MLGQAAEIIQIKFYSKLKELGFFLLWTKEGWRGWGGDVKSSFGVCEVPLCSTDAEVVLLLE